MATSEATGESQTVLRPDPHECDVISLGSERGLLENMKHCKKNPKHEQFIPINDFTVNHLPAPYRDLDIFNFIRSYAALTARLIITMVSDKRPDTFPNSNKPYPFGGLKGCRRMTRVGTGLVMVVGEKSADSCPCDECRQSLTPRTRWWEVTICTAAHVVFDSVEAAHTTAELGYNSPHDKDVERLFGSTLYDSEVDDDLCWFTCITHDETMGTRLLEMHRHCEELGKRVNKTYPSTNSFTAIPPSHRLTWIVSHPHGCYKQISVGEWTYRRVLRNGGTQSTQYTYNTATCPGSSGAPVYILGKSWECWDTHPHSGASGIVGQNISGVWIC